MLKQAIAQTEAASAEQPAQGRERAYRLRHLVIKPCLACTANCPTCASRRDLHRSARHARTLSLDDWRRILAEARDLGVERFDISGGEPTLYPHLVDLIEIGRAYGWYIGLNTNGSLIDRAYAERLLRAGVNRVGVSLYSPEPDVHDSMRRSRGLWHTATEAIRVLRSLEPQFPDFKVVTQTLLCRENHRSLPELLELHHSLGSHLLALTYLEGDFERQYLLTEDEIQDFKQHVLPRAVAFCDKLDGAVRENARRTLESLFSEDKLALPEWARGEYQPVRTNAPPCRRPQEFTILLANGDVHPCNMIEYTHEPVMGNLFEQSLGDIWSGDQWNRFRKELFDRCALCPINLYMGVPLSPR